MHGFRHCDCNCDRHASTLTFQRPPHYPRNCTFASHDWEFLSRYWHPEAFAAEVTDKLISVTLLDEPLVAFHTHGKPVSARNASRKRAAREDWGLHQGKRLP
ncbi:hypothetical protein E2553_07690 [Paraburkholderia dipogonis]|uniref:Uncharacterized protein n=1 Tax=Paraburkholderia dipogonis TaxID=1211383 RepID=A0A4Y8N597_9BURK|nr:hypothetical protein [Paraburkholderia dipogonis]TFE44909.1 hypothetical protein E2553_07690 [Paraburkholderia dipogonis]